MTSTKNTPAFKSNGRNVVKTTARTASLVCLMWHFLSERCRHNESWSVCCKSEREVDHGRKQRVHHFGKHKQNLMAPHSWKQPQLCNPHSSCTLVSNPSNWNYIYPGVHYLVVSAAEQTRKMCFWWFNSMHNIMQQISQQQWVRADVLIHAYWDYPYDSSLPM